MADLSPDEIQALDDWLARTNGHWLRRAGTPVAILVDWLDRTKAPGAYVTSMSGVDLDPLATANAKLVAQHRVQLDREARSGSPRDPEDIAADRKVVDQIKLEGTADA